MAKGTGYTLPMEEWLKVPERKRGIPVWRLSLLIAVTILIIIVCVPILLG